MATGSCGVGRISPVRSATRWFCSISCGFVRSKRVVLAVAVVFGGAIVLAVAFGGIVALQGKILKIEVLERRQEGLLFGSHMLHGLVKVKGGEAVF